MKREEIKKIIKEETEAFLIGEGLIDSLVSLFIAPKLKKDIKKLKNSPEWKEWMQKIKSTSQEMEMINDRMEARLKYYDELEKNADKLGLSPSKIKTMRDLAINSIKINKHFNN